MTTVEEPGPVAEPALAGPATPAARVHVEVTGGPLPADAVVEEPDRLEHALRERMATVSALLEADGAVTLLLDHDAGLLRVRCRIGRLTPPPERVGALDARHPLLERLLATRGPVAVGDLRAQVDLGAVVRELGVDEARALCAAPMRTLGGELVGAVVLLFAVPRAFRAQELQVLEISAAQAAEMLERARLHGEARWMADRERRRGGQLRQLAEAALAISRESDVEQILRLVTESARAIIGTHQGVTSRLLHGWDEASTHVSLSEKYAAWRHYDRTPSGLGVVNAVTRENRPLRLTGPELLAHPEWRGLRDAPDHPPLPDYLAAPLVARDGSNLGLVQLADKQDGTPFSEEDELMLVQLAQMASVGIENAELLQREREARRLAEEQARLQRMLAEASVDLAGSLDLEEVLRAISGIVVPDLADWCSVSLLRPSGRIEPVSEAASDQRLADALRAVFAQAQANLDRPHGIGAVIRTGRSQFMPVIPDLVWREFALSADLDLDELRDMGVRSAIIVPLPRGGRAIGAMMLLRSRLEPYSERELTFAEDLGARAALAIDNAARYTVERRAADILQRSLLPQALPRVPGVRLGARYLPGGSGTRIGGDWYDLIELDGRRVALVVGDVMGRGMPAATVMGQLRAAVRAYTLEGHEPEVLLELLDRLVQRMDPGQLTTCVYGVFDVAEGTLTIASAGHPPPLLLDPNGAARFLDIEPGLPLGAGLLAPGARRQSVHRLSPGATLLLYTDGLVEGRDCPVDEGMRRLREAAEGAADEPDPLCERLVKAMGRDGHHDDDTALLALAVTPEYTVVDAEPEGIFGEALIVPADLRTPSRTRAALRRMLEQMGVASSDAVLLSAHELVTNAVLHGGEPIMVRISLLGRVLRVEVSDGGDRPPTLQHYNEDASTGRGLALVEALSERWGWHPAEHGKVVWCEVAL